MLGFITLFASVTQSTLKWKWSPSSAYYLFMVQRTTLLQMTFHSQRQKTSILQATYFLVQLVFHVADGEATIKNGPKEDKIRRWKGKPVDLSHLVLHARTLSVQGPVTLSHACVL